MAGPKLTLVATCEGCYWLRVDGSGASCAEPGQAGLTLGWLSSDKTPAWCPELRRATVEHARGVLAKGGE